MGLWFTEASTAEFVDDPNGNPQRESKYLHILQQMTPREEYKKLYAQWINEGREPGQTGERLWELMVEMTGTEYDEVVDPTFKQIIEEMKVDDRHKDVMA